MLPHALSELTNILYLIYLLFIYYWLTHSLFLLLLAQNSKLVATAHEQSAMIVDAVCHFQQGVACDWSIGSHVSQFSQSQAADSLVC